MDNFDLTKFLAEGKLYEAMSPQDVVDIADTVAEEFTKESAEEGDFLIYTVGRMEADDMSFELDTDVSAQTPKDLDTRGVGEGWGGIFRIKPTADGYEVRNAEKGGLVAMIDGSGNFKMLSADESRAELDMDRYNDDLDMKDDELNPGMYIDDEEWEKEMGRMDEAGGDAQLMPSDPVIGFSQVAAEFKDKLENNPQIDKIADMIISKMSAEDKSAFVQKFKGKDEQNIFKMAMSMLKSLDEAAIDRKSAAGKFVALLGNLAGINLMALGGSVLGVFIGKVLLGIAVPVIPALISLVVSLIIRNVAGKLLGEDPNYTGLAGLEEGENKKSNKMKKSELKEMIKAAMLEDARTDAEQEGYKDGFEDAKDDIEDKLKDMKVSEAEDVDVEKDVDVDVEDDENVDVDIEKDIKVDDEESEVDIDVKASMPGESEDVEEVQALLMKAQEAAESFGDEKLMDQIGNTITYFTRSHVAGNVSEVDLDIDGASDAASPEMEAELGLEEAKENLNESVVFPMWNKIK